MFLACQLRLDQLFWRSKGDELLKFEGDRGYLGRLCEISRFRSESKHQSAVVAPHCFLGPGSRTTLVLFQPRPYQTNALLFHTWRERHTHYVATGVGSCIRAHRARICTAALDLLDPPISRSTSPNKNPLGRLGGTV